MSAVDLGVNESDLAAQHASAYRARRTHEWELHFVSPLQKGGGAFRRYSPRGARSNAEGCTLQQ